MHAWVSKLDENLNTKPGTDGNYSVSKYNSINTLQKYFLNKLPVGKYKVDIHWNEATKYGKADKSFLHEQKGAKHVQRFS